MTLLDFQPKWQLCWFVWWCDWGIGYYVDMAGHWSLYACHVNIKVKINLFLKLSWHLLKPNSYKYTSFSVALNEAFSFYIKYKKIMLLPRHISSRCAGVTKKYHNLLVAWRGVAWPHGNSDFDRLEKSHFWQVLPQQPSHRQKYHHYFWNFMYNFACKLVHNVMIVL